MHDLSYSLDNRSTLKRFGVVVLKTDITIEDDFKKLINDKDITLYHSRIFNDEEVTVQSLSAMEENLLNSVSLFPTGDDMDVIGYGCTSASSVIGEEKIASIIHKVHPRTQVTNPVRAVKAALNGLNAKKIGFISPYIPAVSKSLQNTLEDASFEITVHASFNEIIDRNVGFISEESIYDAICNVAMQKSCDAIFISCTNLKAVNIIERAEESIQIPVISSNSAMAWHMLKLSQKEKTFQLGKLSYVE